MKEFLKIFFCKFTNHKIYYGNHKINFFLLALLKYIIVILVILCLLVSVAFVTIAERKTMASLQRRIGPNVVGFYGLLQAFADALKLLVKEYIAPTQANLILFFLGPIITLIFSLNGFLTIPFGPGIAISDFALGILYMLAMSSLATYGILLAGWSANSKYAFLGSLRSTAQLISYELILSSAILVLIFLTGSFNLTILVEIQKSIPFFILIPSLYLIFYIAAVAETNRAPFDLAEAESELVSGFMTEHAAGIFVFFFLGEYASVILICILISAIFLGGYEIIGLDFINFFTNFFVKEIENIYISLSNNNLLSLLYPTSLGIKTLFLVFLFILIRASFPRLRFDKLMSCCWTELLPMVIGIILIIPCITFLHNIIIFNYV